MMNCFISHLFFARELKVYAVVPMLVALTTVTYCTADGPTAKLLLRYDQPSRQFVLEKDALYEIEQQTRQGPVRVISAIGDARVGKSTNLNFIRHFLGVNTNQEVQKVFKTSDSMEPCTTGVWMSVLRDSNSAGSTILIDTEGTNLGDNEITDLLSTFSVLMSSGLALFAREGLGNHNVEFLYRLSRLSEELWIQDARTEMMFPELMVILRDALSPSPGKTLQKHTQDFILNERQNYGQTIERHFPRHRIKVRDIPFVDNAKRLNDLKHFARDEYANVASALAAGFKSFSFKKTVNGANMDGKMIADLARQLEDSLNRNSWRGFSDAYLALETSLCERSYQEIVAPLLRKEQLWEIKNSKDRVMERFLERCALNKEVSNARDKISKVIAEKEDVLTRQRELDEQRRQKEEEERERERQAERHRIALERRERELQEQQRAIREAERQRIIEQENLRRAEEERRRIEEEAEARRRSDRRRRRRRRRDTILTAVGGVILGGIFSDSRLKENITAIRNSEFEEIGLHAYSWMWSKKAVDELGLSGKEQGVIAQEVEKLYPWAVVTGDDGYKRVNYEALKQLIMEKKYANALKAWD